MELDWTYFFSLFSMGAFYRASAMVVALGSLSWLLGLVLGFGLWAYTLMLPSIAKPRRSASRRRSTQRTS